MKKLLLLTGVVLSFSSRAGLVPVRALPNLSEPTSIYRLADGTLAALSTAQSMGKSPNESTTEISLSLYTDLARDRVKTTHLKVREYYEPDRLIESPAAFYLYSKRVEWKEDFTAPDIEGDRLIKIDKRSGAARESVKMATLVGQALHLEGCQSAIRSAPVWINSLLYVPVFGDCLRAGQAWKRFKAFIVLDQDLQPLPARHLILDWGTKPAFAAGYADNLGIDPKSQVVLDYREEVHDEKKSLVDFYEPSGKSHSLTFNNLDGFEHFQSARLYQTEKFWMILRGDDRFPRLWLIDKATESVKRIDLFAQAQTEGIHNASLSPLPNGAFIAFIPQRNATTRVVYFDAQGEVKNAQTVEGLSNIVFEPNRQFWGEQRFSGDVFYLSTERVNRVQETTYLYAFRVGETLELKGQQVFNEVPAPRSDLDAWINFWPQFDALASQGLLLVGHYSQQNGKDLRTGTAVYDRYLRPVFTSSTPLQPLYFDGVTLVARDYTQRDQPETKSFRFER